MGQDLPDDAKAVIEAFRFGWMMAEFHGRYGCLMTGVPATLQTSEKRPENALPLMEERSPKELAIQVQRVLTSLATSCNKDCPRSDLIGEPDTATNKVSESIATLSKALISANSGATSKDATWQELQTLLYHWDAWIQDSLAQDTLDQAGAYQLGRGLADIWWARSASAQTSSAGNPYDWAWLLGPTRRTAVSLRLGRLNRYFPADVAAAMRASLQAWGDVADDPAWRGRPDAMSQLEEQVRIWRDVLLGEYNPENLLSWQTVVQNGRYKVLPIIQAFAIELALTLVGLIILMVAILVLTAPAGHNQVLGTVLAILGVFGVSGAAAVAKAKSAANNLAAQLRETLYRQLLAYQITVVPAKQKVGKSESGN